MNPFANMPLPFLLVCGAVVCLNAAPYLRRGWMRLCAGSWPLTSGRIDSTVVLPDGKKGVAAMLQQSRNPVAQIRYSYNVDGEERVGLYLRDCVSEDEAEEFLRGLEGQRVDVAYNPRAPQKSSLSEASLRLLLTARPELPESERAGATELIPFWGKCLLWPFVALAALGLTLSLIVHVGSLMGWLTLPMQSFIVLHIGIFVVFLPSLLAMQRLSHGVRGRLQWKAMMRWTPAWMRYMTYGFFFYAFINFALFAMNASGGSDVPSPVVSRGFSGHWMAFYSFSLAALSSAVNSPSKKHEG
jgi:hypothetical protein